MNTRFEYLYRDGANWKQYGYVIFADAPTKAQIHRLRKAMQDEQNFMADQVRIPEVFLWDANADYPDDKPPGGMVTGFKIADEDHCWHEFEDARQDEGEPNDELHRTFEQFVAEVEAAAAAGWKEFDPSDRKKK